MRTIPVRISPPLDRRRGMRLPGLESNARTGGFGERVADAVPIGGNVSPLAFSTAIGPAVGGA
jgi:hypothetical protein